MCNQPDPETKTEYLILARKNNAKIQDIESLTIDGNQIDFQECVRDLLILIDSNLILKTKNK